MMTWKSYKTLRNKCNEKIKKTKSNHHKKCPMITSINQINFGRKLKTFFLENHNQWQTYQLINVLVYCILQYNSSKIEKIHLQILTGVILQNIHQKLGKLLDFLMLLDYSIICTKRVKKLKNLTRNPPVLTT